MGIGQHPTHCKVNGCPPYFWKGVPDEFLFLVASIPTQNDTHWSHTLLLYAAYANVLKVFYSQGVATNFDEARKDQDWIWLDQPLHGIEEGLNASTTAAVSISTEDKGYL